MGTKVKRQYGSRPLFEVLEDQVLYSADALGGLDATALANRDEAVLEATLLPASSAIVDASAQQAQAPAIHDFHARHEIVFIDASVPDYQQLVDDLASGTGPQRNLAVVLLDAHEDGVAQIGRALAGYASLDAVHIISHGAVGEVQLGNSSLSSDTLPSYENALESWGESLSEDADLLFYGCDLAGGGSGEALVDSIARLTGADVAASNDLTGAARSGGDWDLEYQRGTIDSAIALSAEAQLSWNQVLSVAVDTTSTASTTGSSVNVSHTTTAAGNRLMLVGVSIRETGSESVSSMTYNGQNLSLVGTQIQAGARVEIWSLVAPDPGTYNVVVNLSGAGGGTNVGVMTFTGVDQSTPLGAFASNNGDATSGSATVSSAADELVFGVVAVKDSDQDLVPGAGQTERWDLFTGSEANGGGSTEAGAASVDLAWTWSASTDWAIGGVSIKPGAANNAPVLDNSKNPALTAIDEDAGAPSGAVGSLVSDLVDFASPAGEVDNVTDADPGADLGIAITAADTSNGAWFYSIDNGANWNALGAVSDANARLLAADNDTRLYFQPNANYSGTLANAITFHAWDQTSGSNGGTADLAASTETLRDEFNVRAYNNNDGTVNWTSSWTEIAEPTGSGASSGPVQVSPNVTYAAAPNSLRIGGTQPSNPDPGFGVSREADLSMASTATLTFDYQRGTFGSPTPTAGTLTLDVSSNGGTSWTTLQTYNFDSTDPSQTSQSFDISGYTAVDTQIRFLTHGPVDDIVFFIDDIQIEYTSGTGGTTAFSAATDTASLIVNPVNDAPVLDNTGAMVLTNVLMNTTDPAGDLVSAIIASAGGNRITDVFDAGSVEGLAITAVDDTNGSWEYSIDGGTNWSAFGAVSNSSSVLLTATASDLIRFVPDANYIGNATVTFRAWDTSDGNVSGATGINTGTGGGTSAFSSATEAANVAVEGTAIKLLLSTTGDVGPAYSKPTSGAPGLPSWSDGSLIAMRDSNINFGENNTSGAFTSLGSFNAFAADGDAQINGLHFVTSDLTVAGPGINGGSIDLLADDILFVTNGGAETLSTAAVGAPAGWTNNIATAIGSVYAFRAESPDDYSSGYFRLLFDPAVNVTTGITLVEKATTIADVVVDRGDFLFLQSGNIQKNNIYWYDTSANTSALLIDGADIGIEGGGGGKAITGLELVETGANVGGVPLGTGDILITLDKSDTLGDNNISVKEHDVVVLNFTATTLGAGTAAADATVFFDGDGNVKFDSSDENLDALSLIVEGVGSNQAPVLGNSGPAVDFTENGSPIIIDPTIAVADADSTDFAGGLLQVSISAGGAPGDRLSIFDQGVLPGEIGVTGADVTYGGVIIGTFTGGLDSADPLVVNLNANADAVSTRALMRNITFWNSSDAPSTAARTIDFSLSDGDGGSSNPISQSATVTAMADPPVAVDDRVGLDFDGIDDYVAIADSASLTMSNTMTMEAWVKADPSANVNRMIVNKEGEYEVALFSDGTINWAFANTDPGWAWHNTGHVVAVNEWTHIAVAYDNGEVTTYVNGTLVDAYQGSGPIGDAHATLDELRIGGRSNNPAGQYFDGEIDEVRIWNTARSQAQIQSSLDQNLSGAEAGLAAYWNFNEGTGSSASDLTANGNNGTLVDGGAGTAGAQWTGYRTDQDTSLTVTAALGILDNDIDGDGDPLTVTQVNGSIANVGALFTLPSGANLTVGSLGAFIYDPNGAFDHLDAGESATDTFTYLVDDGNGGTDSATVTITIDGTEDAPVIGGTASGAVAEDGTLTASDTLTITDADTSDNPVSFNNEASTPGDNGYGNFAITGNTWTYTLNNAHAAVQALDVGETLSDTHTFTASDGSTQVVSITINGAEDAPVIGGTASGAVAEDGTLTASDSLTITDADTSDNPVSFNNEASTPGDNGYGNFAITGNTWTYTLNNAHASVQALDVGETLSDTHTFTASDGSTQVVTITINGAEDAAVLGGTATGAVAEDGTLTASDALTITDTDTSDNPVAFNNEPGTPGDNGYGSFAITGNTWTYTLNNAHASVQALDVGETLSDTHTFTASDGSTQVVTITINGAEDAPVIGGTTSGAVAEDGTLTASDSLTITDADTSDNPVSFNNEASNLGDNGYGNFAITGNTWTYTLNNAHAAVQALDVGETLSDTHTFTASDGSTQVVTITINGAEDAPVIGGTTSGAVAEDGTLTASDSLTITDADTSDNPVSFNNEASNLGDNGYGNFAITGNTWTYTLNNAHAAVQALDVGETLSDTHTFTASDGSTQVVTITINGAEDAPVIGGTASGAVAEDGTLTASDSLTITDADTSDNPVSFNNEASNLGDNGYGNFAITGNTWTYTLNNAHAAVQALDVGETLSDTHTFTASDGSTQVVTITINGAEDAPVIGGTASGAVAEDGTLTASDTLTITDADTSDNPVSFNNEPGTLGDNGYGNFAITGNTWTYTLNNAHASVQALDAGETLSDTHTFTASDGSTQVVTITINGAEDAPVIGGTATGAVAEDGTLTASNALTITDTDTSDNPVSFNNEASTLGDNGYGNFQITGNTWTYTLNNAHAAVQALDVGETLSDTHTFTASDGSTQVVTITINGAEDASVIGGTASGAVAEDGTLTASDTLTITDVDTSDNPVSFNNEASTPGDNGYGNFQIAGNTWTYSLNNAHASVQALDVGETLSDIHTFTASDGSTRVVSITINGAEDAPVIGGTASGTVAEDGTLTASDTLSITDADTSDNPVSFNNEASTPGDNGYGNFQITGNTWTYTLNNAHASVQALDVGETLSDTHTFTASDGSTQVVTITINGAEDAPVIGGTATGAVAEDGTLTASDTLTITDADTSDNPVSFNNEPSTPGDNGYGNFQIAGNTWVYTLNNAHASVQALDVGETLSDTHTFTASDGSTQVVTVTINGAEDAPVIGGTASGTVAEDGTLTASDTLSITDADTSDNPVSFNNEASTPGDNGYGNFQITGNTWTYTLNNAHASVQALDVGETLSDTHTFTASDGSTQVVAITINGAEDAPVIGGTATGAVAEDGTLSASDTLTITDTDTSDNPVSFNNEASTPGDNGYGNFQIAGNTWVYTLNNAHASVQALDVGETLSDTHTFTASDGSTQVVTVTINGAEDAPVLGGTASGAVAEDGTLTASDTLTITDADTSDNPVSFNNEPGTPGDNGYGNFAITGNTWTYTLNNAHASVQALDAGETLSDTHTFTASDGSTQVVTITINGAEDAPVIGGVATGTVAEDGALTASDTLTITDTDTSDNPVSFNNEASTPGDNGYGNFAITGNTWTYTLNNAHAAVQALDVGETLSDTHTFTASDGSTQVVTITINGAEDAPVIGGTASGAVAEDGTLTASDTLTITDVDASDNPVSFNNETSTLGDNGYGNFQITGNTWTYTLNNAHASVQALDVGETLSDSHTFTASDGSTRVVTIAINGAEDAPVIGGTATGAVAEDGTLMVSDTLTITDVDTSDNPISFNNEPSTPGDNGYGDFEMTANTWRFTLNNAHAAVQALGVGMSLSDTHTFTASDGSIRTVTVTIDGTNDIAVIGGVNRGALTEDIAVLDGQLAASAALTIADTDAGEAHFQAATVAGTYGSLSIDAAGSWSYSADNAQLAIQELTAGQSVKDVLTVSTADGATHTVTITISGAEDVDNNATDPLAEEPATPDYQWLEEVVAVANIPGMEPTVAIDGGTPGGIDEEQNIDSTLDSEPFTDPLEARAVGDLTNEGSGSTPAAPRTPTRDATVEAGGLADALLVPEIVTTAQKSSDTKPESESGQTATELAFNEKLHLAMQAMREEMDETARDERLSERQIDAVLRVSGTALSAGSLAWMLRGASMFASALSAVPTWAGFDPLPILAKSKRSPKNPDPDVIDDNETEASVGRVLDSLEHPDDTDHSRTRGEDLT